MKVFASCTSYTLGQMMGPKVAHDLMRNAVADLEHEQVLPSVHALRELRALAEIELMVDSGATHIAKTRSRHFAAALESSCDAWLTIDDDVDTTRETLGVMLGAISDDAPRVVLAPYVLRNDPGLAAIEWSPVYLDREVSFTRGLNTPIAGRVRRAQGGAFGLVAMNRLALEVIAPLVPSFHDEDGKTKPAAFLELLEARGRWLGEDLAFFARIQGSGVIVEALVSGETTHNGVRLDLSELR